MAIRLQPDDMPLRRQLAELRLFHKDFAGARDHLLAIRDASGPASSTEYPSEIALLLARTWFGLDDYRQALSIVADLTGFSLDSRSFTGKPSDKPPPTAAYVLLAEILRTRLGDAKAADAAIERCVRVHPDDPDVLVPFAWLMLKRGEPHAAIEAATHATAAAPNNPGALVVKATALAAAGDAAAASNAYAEAVQECPDDDYVFGAASNHLAHHGTAGQATAMLDVAWKHLPRQEGAVLVFLASMPIDATTLPELSRQLDTIVEAKRADSAEAVVLGARIHEAQGHWSAAEKLLPKARAIVPASVKPRFDDMLAKCFMNLGEPGEALGVYERLQSHQFFGWRSLLGSAEARLALGQADAAAEAVQKLLALNSQLEIPKQIDRAIIVDAVIPSLSTIIRVTAAQPREKRDWQPVEKIMAAIARLDAVAGDVRVATLQAELLAAKGDLDAALETLPAADTEPSSPTLDSLRVRLVGDRDGRDAMRAALAALPPNRRACGPVILASAEAEARNAAGDDRGWLRSLAGIAESIAAPDEAAGTLHSLAAVARKAGWHDEARNLQSRAAQILPGDFRGPLATALEAAHTGDAKSAAAAAEQVIATEGPKTPRGRVAAAAAIIAVARSEGAEKSSSPPTLNDATRKSLDEARSLLTEAEADRKRWQPIAVLRAEVESLLGKKVAAVTQLQRAVDEGPRDPDLVLRLAATLEELRCHSDAERLRDEVAPALLDGGDRLAIDSRLHRLDFPAAADRALAAIDVDRSNAETLAWLGRLCLRGERFETAIAMYQRATEVEPSNPDTWIGLANCLMLAGRREDSAAVLDSGREAVSEADRKVFLARAAHVVGQDDAAERAFQEAVGKGIEGISAASRLVDFLIEQGRSDDAKKWLRATLDVGSGYRSDFKAWAQARLDWMEATSSKERPGAST